MGVETESAAGRDEAPSGAFERLDEIAALVGDSPFLILDFDGTLSRIVAHPEQAALEPGLREVLAAWARRFPVAVVSGRSVKDVRQRVGVEDAIYVGDHGFVTVQGGREVLASPVQEEHLAALDDVAQDLQRSIKGVEGAWVERKRCTLAVHTRQVPPWHKGEVERRVDDALQEVRWLCKGYGKEVVEVCPDVAWDKGRAVQDLLRRRDAGHGQDEKEGNLRWIPVVVGDDVSDEAMFQAVGAHSVTVFVGNGTRATAARYRVADPGQVRELLMRLGGRLGLT